MNQTPKMGRPSVFAPKSKNRKHRFQGVTTKVGAAAFEAARKRLAKLAALKTVSDGDVFEFLARGESATVEYLDAHK